MYVCMCICPHQINFMPWLCECTCLLIWGGLLLILIVYSFILVVLWTGVLFVHDDKSETTLIKRLYIYDVTVMEVCCPIIQPSGWVARHEILNKMAVIMQTTCFPDAFSLNKRLALWFKIRGQLFLIDNKLALVWLMTWSRTGDKPLPEPLVVNEDTPSQAKYWWIRRTIHGNA